MESRGVTIFKYGVILIVAILLFMFWRGCRNEGGTKTITDTVEIVRDTIITKTERDTDYVPKPYKITEYKTDTLETFETVNVDTAAILKDYLATRYYKDSVAVQYGKIYIYDTISINRIMGRGVSSSFQIPTIRETITLRQPKRTIAYIGFEGIGNHETIVYGVGASLGFKFKNDKYYGIKALMSKDGNPLYGLEFKLPIKLKR